MYPSIPVLAEDFTTQNYVYDNYAVSYNVTNSWGDTEVVSVTLSNTGDSTIENWMLYFDPNGSTSSIWDAQWAETSTGVSYVKNAGYNARIEPNSSGSSVGSSGGSSGSSAGPSVAPLVAVRVMWQESTSTENLLLKQIIIKKTMILQTQVILSRNMIKTTPILRKLHRISGIN